MPSPAGLSPAKRLKIFCFLFNFMYRLPVMPSNILSRMDFSCSCQKLAVSICLFRRFAMCWLVCRLFLSSASSCRQRDGDLSVLATINREYGLTNRWITSSTVWDSSGRYLLWFEMISSCVDVYRDCEVSRDRKGTMERRGAYQ